MSDETCKQCTAKLIGDWLSTQDGEFCNHKCAERWCATQYKQSRGRVEESVLAEQMNELSEQVLGYREGSFEQLVAEVKTLKEVQKRYQANDQVDRLYDQIHELNDFAVELEQGG